MGKIVGTLSGAGIVALALLLLVAPRNVYATTGVNQEISFEGKIVTAAGLNIPDGTYNMEFKIYTAAGSCNPTTGVGCTLGWTEDWLVSASNGVTFTSGTYQVNLDHVAANNFSGIDFNTYPLYLSLQIGNTSSCAPAGNFTANCGGDGEMKPYIKFTSTPYALNSNALQGLSASAFGQLASNQTWTGTNTFQPTTNINSVTIKQTSVGSPTADIFNVQTANSSSVIQITGPSANNAAVNISSVGAQAITLTSGAALTFTGAANSTWDLGAAHTLSLQTTNNGPITTGTGLLTVGGNLTFSGSTARTITGPGAGGLTISDGSGAITITGGAASTWDIGNNTLSIQTTNNGPITTGTGLLTSGGNLTFSGSTARTITGPGAGGLTVSDTTGAITITGGANSTWDLGAAHTLSLQTTNNGPITTGTGLWTQGGNLTFSGTTARTITGPSTGGLTVTAAGPVALTATGSSALTLTGSAASTWSTSSGALTITSAAAAVWSTSTGTLAVESASGSAFTASSQGAGQSNFGTVGTGTTVLGNSTGSTQLSGPLYTSSTKGVLIGDGSVSATPLLLQLNNSSVDPASEASGNCSTTINSGAIYYSAATASNNTTTNEVRGCINGTWTDVVTADQLGIMLLGVVQDSGPTNPGDITGLSGYGNAPCKVAWASTTSVTVAPCTAYSGGRKVVISSSVTVSGLGTAGSIRFQHICLTGTNGSPQATASNTSETAGLPTFSAAAPVLCLATVKLNTTPAITNIYDTRSFTTSLKEYVGNSVAVAPGWVVIVDTTGDNLVKTTTSAGTLGVRGAVAVGNPSAVTTNVGAIIVTSGPAFVKFTAAPTIGFAAQTGTTAGYISSTNTSHFEVFYGDLGQIVANGNSAACNASTNCQWSALVDVLPF